MLAANRREIFSTRFELLRSFWTEATFPGLSGLLMDSGVPLRVLEFNSPSRIRRISLTSGGRRLLCRRDAGEYIVLPPSPASGSAAHEYAHAMFHARGLQLPDWLAKAGRGFFHCAGDEFGI